MLKWQSLLQGKPVSVSEGTVSTLVGLQSLISSHVPSLKLYAGKSEGIILMAPELSIVDCTEKQKWFYRVILISKDKDLDKIVFL